MLLSSVKLIDYLLIYLQNRKQLLRFGLLYNIKVIEDRHHVELTNIFSLKVLSVIIAQAEFSPVNCPLPPSSPVNYPCQMYSDEFKSHLRNVKYFLGKGNLDWRSNLCNIQQSYFRKSTTKFFFFFFFFI